MCVYIYICKYAHIHTRTSKLQVTYAPVIELEIALKAGGSNSASNPNGTAALNGTNASTTAAGSKKIVIDGSEILEDRVDPRVQVTIPRNDTLRPITAINILLLEVQNRIAAVYPRFIRISTEGDQSARVIIPSTQNVTNQHIFYHDGSLPKTAIWRNYTSVNPSCAGCPKLNASGELTFELAPHQYGVSTVTFKVTSRAAFSQDSSKEIMFNVDFVVMPVNQPPSAHIPPSIGVIETTSRMAIPNFATNISVGPGNEAWQIPTFTVHVNSDTPGFFAELPEIDSTGTLRYTLAKGAHGKATLKVHMTDDGGTEFGGQIQGVGFPVTVDFTVYPLPQVTSISPCVGPGHLPMTVTVRGRYFAGEYFRTSLSESQGGIMANIAGEAQCGNFRLISDSEFVCVVPPRFGRGPFLLTTDGGSTVNGLGQVISTWTRTKRDEQVRPLII